MIFHLEVEVEAIGTTYEDIARKIGWSVARRLENMLPTHPHIGDTDTIKDDERNVIGKWEIRKAPAQPQADPLLLTAEAYRAGQIETLEAKCDCGQPLYGIHRVHWCNEAATKRKVLIQVEGGVAEVLECPDDVDVTIDDKDAQEDLAGLEEPAECNGDGCKTKVYPEDPYFATPCGTYCTEHMREHSKDCPICRNEFQVTETREAAPPDPQAAAIDEAYRKAAKKQYHEEGLVEIDDLAEISKVENMADAGGAYVMAWVWVDNTDAGLCRECGKPSDNCELCSDCAGKEDDYWTDEKTETV